MGLMTKFPHLIINPYFTILFSGKKGVIFMNGSFRKKSNGSWEFRVWVDLPDGSRVQKSFCRRTKTLAKAAYDEWLEHKDEQIIKRKTVAGWGEEWLEIKRDSVSYRTYQNYELYWRNHIKPALGKKQLDQVKPINIEKLLAATSHLSKSARHHIYITVNQIMKAAVQNELCRKNPCDAVSVAADEPLRAVQVFSLDEIQTILRNLDKPFGTAIALMLFAGLRSEEVMGLRWGDIDQNEKVITVCRVVTRVANGEYMPVERTKNGKVRYVPYGDELAVHLAQARKTSIYVVPAVRGGYMTPGSFRRQYETFFADLPVRKLSPHKLRHTYATYLIRGGAELRAVQSILGHQSVGVTEIYTHVNVEDQRRATGKLAY